MIASAVRVYGQIEECGTGTVETRWQRKDGSIINVLLSSTPLDLSDRSKGIMFAALDITERKKAEEALQESERKLRTLMANLPGIAYRCAFLRDWPFDFVSEGALALTGYTPDELAAGGGIPYGNLIHPDDEQRVWDTVRDAVSRHVPFDVEYRIRTKDGAEKWVFERGRAVSSPGAESPFVEGFITDITEHKRAEAAVRESEKKYRELYEGSRDGFAALDNEGRFVECNSVFLEMLGYSKEEITGLTLQAITPRRWHAEEERIGQEQLYRRGYSDVYEKEYIRKDGSVFPAEVRAYVSRDAAGRQCGVWAVVRDITARKQAELALRDSEQNYREIFDAVNDAVLIHDPVTGAILDANRTVLETYGFGLDEILRLKAGGLTSQESPYNQEEALTRIRKAAEEGPQLFEWLSCKKNGDPIWEEVNLRTAVIGGKRRVLAVVRDITDRKKAEAQAQQHLAELTRAWHANMLGEMASGLAHELNQPLCAVVNYRMGACG